MDDEPMQEDAFSALPSYKVRRLHIVHAGLVMVQNIAQAGTNFLTELASLAGSQINYDIDREFQREAHAEIDAMTNNKQE